MYNSIEFVEIKLRITANTMKYFISVTNWLASDMDPAAWMSSGFDDDYEQAGGWMDLGKLWEYKQVYYEICLK